MANSTNSTSHSTRLSPSTEVRVLNQFDNVGIDPQILVGKKIIACTRNSALILRFSDKTRAVLRHKGIFSCEKEFYAQPFLELDESLKQALQPLTTGNDGSTRTLQPSTDAGVCRIGFQIKIEEAIVGQRPSVDPSVKTSHRVIGFKLQGMDRVGWVEVQSGQYYSPRGSGQIWYDYLDLVVERKPNPCTCPGSECLFQQD